MKVKTAEHRRWKWAVPRRQFVLNTSQGMFTSDELAENSPKKLSYKDANDHYFSNWHHRRQRLPQRHQIFFCVCFINLLSTAGRLASAWHSVWTHCNKKMLRKQGMSWGESTQGTAVLAGIIFCGRPCVCLSVHPFCSWRTCWFSASADSKSLLSRTAPPWIIYGMF